MRRRRLLWLLPVALLIAVAYTAWSAWQVRGDLVEARAAAARLESVVGEDSPERREALDDLRRAAAQAHDRTDGPYWTTLSRLPVVGDDVAGVQALTASLDLVAGQALGPMLDALALVDGVVAKGRIDPGAVQRLQGPVADSAAGFGQAAELVRDLDSSGYAGPVKDEFDEYTELVTSADQTLASARTATKVLPAMLGDPEPRNYLLLFQNNAEIRGTGGVPGAWALLHTDDGRLTLPRQGSTRDFPGSAAPVLPLTLSERRIFGDPYGAYFQNVGYAPDFPRSAELAGAHWSLRFPGEPLDGVIALDPVALGYLLEGTGPVQVFNRTLTAGNARYELLNRPYQELTVPQQDLFFAAATRAILDRVTSRLDDPPAFVGGIARAVGESRLLVASFDSEEAEELAGSRVEGVLTRDDGTTPHVDVAVNAATASKLSYYLRYAIEVEATGCADDRQTLHAEMRLRQTIPPAKAAGFPDYLAGQGATVDRGEQLLLLPVYGPFGGSIDSIQVDGSPVDATIRDDLGRPVAVLVVHLDSTEPVSLSWRMQTATGQVEDAEVWATPSMAPGSLAQTVPSAC